MLWRAVAIFGVGYWLGRKHAKASVDPHDWLDDLLLQGYAADQVADITALPAPTQSAIVSVANSSGVPRGWLAVLVAKGVPVAKLATAAQAILAQCHKLGAPADSRTETLAVWRDQVVAAGQGVA
jgi:hypothetical protein